MEKVKVALVNLPTNPVKEFNRYKHMITENLGIEYIASYIEQYGHSATIIDCQTEMLGEQELLSKLERENFCLIGFSISSQDNFSNYIGWIKNVKEKLSIPIVLGGHFPSFEYKNIFNKYRYIDYIIVGEGECTWREMCDNIRSKESFESISGLVINRDGVSSDLSTREFVEDIDIFPFPKREHIDIIQQSGQRVFVIASRGCYAKCSFCSISSFYKGCKRRIRSAKNVAEELEELQMQFGVEKIRFADDIFVDSSENSIKWLKELEKELSSRKLKFNIMISMRVADIKEEILNILQRIGVRVIFIGVESLNDQILKKLNKGITRKQINAALDIISEYESFKVLVGYIMFEPYSSWEEFKDNFRTFCTFKYVYFDNFYNELRPYSGTRVREELERDNRLIAKDFTDIGNFVYLDKKVEFMRNVVEYVKQDFLTLDDLSNKFSLKEKEMRTQFKKLARDREISEKLAEKMAFLKTCGDDIFKIEVKTWIEFYNQMFCYIDDENFDYTLNKKFIDNKKRNCLDNFYSWYEEKEKLLLETEKILREGTL